MFTELKNRGLADVLVLVCDGLKGRPKAVETIWPRTVAQASVGSSAGTSSPASGSARGSHDMGLWSTPPATGATPWSSGPMTAYRNALREASAAFGGSPARRPCPGSSSRMEGTAVQSRGSEASGVLVPDQVPVPGARRIRPHGQNA
ncbi:hypothetical protein GCM10009735_82530 [Actinomadura chokoriensis]